MKEYLLILTPDERSALGAIRCLPNLLVAYDKYLYVRGIDEAVMVDKRIRQLPVLHSYMLDDEQRLFPLNGVTPSGKLPLLKWLPIAEFIDIKLPVSAMPGKLTTELPIQLIQANTTSEGCALITTLTAWKAYAENAPSARLEHLQFAAAPNGDVLVMGTPLPPVKGKELYKDNEILLPAGYAFQVPLIAAMLQKKFNADDDSVLLFMPGGEWYRVAYSSFVQATRSAVRLTSLTDVV